MTHRPRAARAALALAATLLATAGCATTNGPGTRVEPTPVGEAITIGAWRVEVGGTTFDATDAVLATSPTNEEPAEGRQYALVPIRVTYNGTTTGLPWFHLGFGFVGTDGGFYGDAAEDQCGEIPGSMVYLGELSPGEVRTGNVCVSVPSEALEGGTWHVRPEGSHPTWTGHFAAQEEGPTGPGSQTDPLEAGSELDAGPYRVTLGPAELAEPLPDGRAALLAPVEVTLAGTSPSVAGIPAQDLRIAFVSADGEVFAATANGCTVPDPLPTGTLRVGGSATGTVCVAVPPELLDAGAWNVALASEALGWTNFVTLWE